jgi:16S rRNA processing protein RimM
MRRKSEKDSAVKREELIEIGQVAKPWGIRGEVKIRMVTDVPERFQSLEGVYLYDVAHAPEWHLIESVKRLKGAVAVKFEKIDSPEAAEGLRGFEVGVPESERAPLGDDEYYIYDLAGLSVVDADGQPLGILTKVYQGAGHDVFEVDVDGVPVLVPSVKEYVLKVDVEAGEVMIRLPVMEEGE